MDWESLGIGAASWLLGYVVRKALDARTWSRIRRVAVSVLSEPEQTNDPRTAVSVALNRVLLNKLAAEAEKVSRAFVVNGSNRIPKLDIDIVEVKASDDE